MAEQNVGLFSILPSDAEIRRKKREDLVSLAVGANTNAGIANVFLRGGALAGGALGEFGGTLLGSVINKATGAETPSVDTTDTVSVLREAQKQMAVAAQNGEDPASAITDTLVRLKRPDLVAPVLQSLTAQQFKTQKDLESIKKTKAERVKTEITTEQEQEKLDLAKRDKRVAPIIKDILTKTAVPVTAPKKVQRQALIKRLNDLMSLDFQAPTVQKAVNTTINQLNAIGADDTLGVKNIKTAMFEDGTTGIVGVANDGSLQVLKDGRFRPASKNVKAFVDVTSTQEALQPADKKQAKELVESLPSLGQYTRIHRGLVRLLDESLAPETLNGVIGALALQANSLISQAQGVLSLMSGNQDIDVDQEMVRAESWLASELDSNPRLLETLLKLDIDRTQFLSAITPLVYLRARVFEPNARAITDKDFENHAKSLISKSANPDAIRTALNESFSQILEATREQLRAAGPNVRSELAKRYGATDDSPEAIIAKVTEPLPAMAIFNGVRNGKREYIIIGDKQK